MPNDELGPAPAVAATGGGAMPPARRKVVLHTLMSLDGAVDDPGRYFSARRLTGDVPDFDPMLEENENRIIST